MGTLKILFIAGLVLIAANSSKAQHSDRSLQFAIAAGVSSSGLKFDGPQLIEDRFINSIGSPFFGLYIGHNVLPWIAVGVQPMLLIKGTDQDLNLIFIPQDVNDTDRNSIRLWTISVPVFLKLRGFSQRQISPFMELGPQLDIRVYNQLSAVYQSDVQHLREAFEDISPFSLGWWAQLGLEAIIGERRYGLGLAANVDLSDMQPDPDYSIQSGTFMIVGRVFFK